MSTIAGLDATTVTTGQKAVTTAGTAVQLTSSTKICSEGLFLRANSANTGKIWWGDSTVLSNSGVELAAGESVFIPLRSAAAIYINSAVNGEGVTFALI